MIQALDSIVQPSFDKSHLTDESQTWCPSLDSCLHNDFAQLPAELILHIFSYFSETTLASTIPLVCKEWKVFANTDLLWRQFFKRQVGHEGFNPLLTWKESYVCRRNLERGFSQQKIHCLGKGIINRFNIDAKGRLLLEKIVDQQWKIEVWDAKKIRCIQKHMIKDSTSAALASDGENVIYTLWQLMRNYSLSAQSSRLNFYKKVECWKLNVHLLTPKQEEFWIQGYTHLGERPVIKYIDLYQNHMILKVDHLYLFIFDLLQKKPYIFPLKGNHSHPDIIYRSEAHLWLADGDALQLYDIPTKQCKKEIALPIFDRFHSAALMKDRLIVLMNKKMSAYELIQDQFQEKWSVSMESGHHKTIIVSTDLLPYFGLYHDKKLRMYELMSGKALGEFKDIPTKQITLNVRSIHYLNENNELVTRLFGLNDFSAP